MLRFDLADVGGKFKGKEQRRDVKVSDNSPLPLHSISHQYVFPNFVGMAT